ncbi:hypothetical protein FJY90_02880 [Candidatus Gottesmanbacteria bacterium]|nr:hypothetical protein [Candidatus Gottesmanbacteria bacterium]
MTPAELKTYIHFKCRTNAITFSDANILALLKIRKQEIDRELLKTGQKDLFVIYTENLVADQRQYPLQSDIIAGVYRVEAKLDGTNWLKLNPMTLQQHDKPTNETNITYYFANLEGECFYEIIHNSLYIYSGTITAVTSGLKTWYAKHSLVISDLTSTTDMAVNPNNTTHGIPTALHEILARGVIIDYKESREKPIPLSERELKYEFDLKKALAALRLGDYDEEVIGQLPDQTDRANEGANY